jgi:hypothetical protein
MTGSALSAVGRASIESLTLEAHLAYQARLNALEQHKGLLLKLNAIADGWGDGALPPKRAPKGPHAVVDFNWKDTPHEFAGAILELHNQGTHPKEKFDNLLRDLLTEKFFIYHRDSTPFGEYPSILEFLLAQTSSGVRVNLMVKLVDWERKGE